MLPISFGLLFHSLLFGVNCTEAYPFKRAAEVPPRVEYELTAMALELAPIFKQLSDWGNKTPEFGQERFSIEHLTSYKNIYVSLKAVKNI